MKGALDHSPDKRTKTVSDQKRWSLSDQTEPWLSSFTFLDCSGFSDHKRRKKKAVDCKDMFERQGCSFDTFKLVLSTAPEVGDACNNTIIM